MKTIPSLPASGTSRWITLVTLSLALQAAPALDAQEPNPGVVELRLETKSDLDNRWRPVPVQAYKVRDGRIYLPADRPQGYYRLAIQAPPSRDLDGDGIPNHQDNCHLIPNPNQADQNQNGIGDVCEIQGSGPGVEVDHPNPYQNIPQELLLERTIRPIDLPTRPVFQANTSGGPDFVPSDRGTPGRQPPAGQEQAGGSGGGTTFDSSPTGLVGDDHDDRCTLDNYFILELGSHVNAGSSVVAIELIIGSTTVYLGAPSGGFAPNQILQYNFNNSSCSSCWDNMDPDDWDKVVLRNPSGDGIQVKHVEMVHSSEKVLDSSPNAWLDRYYGSRMDFSLETGLERWAHVLNSRVTALYYASQDIGQTGAEKYVDKDVAWCSEFASWALRQNGLNTPTGSISTSTLSTYFSDRGRHFTRAQVEAGDYMPRAGDYFSVNDGDHSVLFVGWETDVGATPTSKDRYRTIEGNTCNAVRSRTRDWKDVQFVGNAQ